jgi:hypothetical protein
MYIIVWFFNTPNYFGNTAPSSVISFIIQSQIKYVYSTTTTFVVFVYILYILAEFKELGLSNLRMLLGETPKSTGVLQNCTIMYLECAVGWFNKRKQITLKCAE